MIIKQFYAHQTTQIIFSLVCLYGLFLLLNFETINQPFSVVDTPLLLAQALLYSPLEYFTEPSKYQLLSFAHLTPWITLSWDLDYTLFQLEAKYYRVHHLLSAGLLLGIVYLVLYRLTRSILITSLFCFAIITLPATFEVFDHVVSRHYLEGMIFSLLSFYFAQCYNRTGKLIGLVGSVLLYILSITAKEVFVPLPGVLFFVFHGGVRRKIMLILPYSLALLAYLVWRIYMLGDFGGYSYTTTLLDQIKDSQGLLILLHVVLNLARSLFTTIGASVLMFALFSLLLFINFRRLSISVRIGLLVGVAGLMLPILALHPYLATAPRPGRWFFTASITFLLFFAYLCSITESRVLTGVVLVVVLACSVQACVVRIQKPLHGPVAQKVYMQILKSDPDSYLKIPTPLPIIERSLANWVYVGKLHNGEWGTLKVSDEGQLHYHDITGKTAMGVRGNALPMTEASWAGRYLELSIIADYNSESDVLTFNFTNEISSNECFVYIYGEHNGLLFGNSDCRHWANSYQTLVYWARGTGYKLSDMSIALWTKHPDQRLYSKPVKLRDIIDMDVM